MYINFNQLLVQTNGYATSTACFPTHKPLNKEEDNRNPMSLKMGECDAGSQAIQLSYFRYLSCKNKK